MKVCFIDLLRTYDDKHNIYALSSILKQHNHDVSFVSTRSMNEALKRTAALKPDLLLYSTFSSTILLFSQFDERIKQMIDVTSIAGGPGTTGDWEIIKKSTIDAVCIGEGEYALPAFIENGLKSIKNIFRKEDPFPSDFFPLADVNALPFPDRSIVYQNDSLLRNNPTKQFISGRGCPYQCTYCFNHRFNHLMKGKGPVIRQKSVDYLFDEIRNLQSFYPLKQIVFQDDIFVVNKEWFLEYARRFPKEVGLPYTCNVRANLIDEEIVYALKTSGCTFINWSIESGDEQYRNEVLKRYMTDDQILNAARLFRKYKIKFRIGNMIGLPGETDAQMQKTIELNIQAKPELGLANIFVPFPGLDLTQYAKENGFLLEKHAEMLPKNYFSRISMNLPEQQKMMIYKTFCLFPIFVRFPNVYYNLALRRFLYSLPKFVLRFIYEIVYTTTLASFYAIKTPLLHKMRMARRYVRNN